MTSIITSNNTRINIVLINLSENIMVHIVFLVRNLNNHLLETKHSETCTTTDKLYTEA